MLSHYHLTLLLPLPLYVMNINNARLKSAEKPHSVPKVWPNQTTSWLWQAMAVPEQRLRLVLPYKITEMGEWVMLPPSPLEAHQQSNASSISAHLAKPRGGGEHIKPDARSRDKQQASFLVPRPVRHCNILYPDIHFFLNTIYAGLPAYMLDCPPPIWSYWDSQYANSVSSNKFHSRF